MKLKITQSKRWVWKATIYKEIEPQYSEAYRKYINTEIYAEIKDLTFLELSKKIEKYSREKNIIF